jgi:hypothetical protein
MPRSGGSVPPKTLASICAVVAGAALTLLLLDLDYNANNVIAVANPVEKMLGLRQPWSEYGNHGLRMIGVPFNNFDGLEPGGAAWRARKPPTIDMPLPLKSPLKPSCRKERPSTAEGCSTPELP